ncbi:M48 family metallopeptidase [Desulfovulcanus sp.]
MSAQFYLLLIIFILVGHFILNGYLNYLNLKSLDPSLPSEFKDVFDQNLYAKSQEYTKATTKLELIESFYFLTITIFLILSGTFNKLDLLVRSFGLSESLRGLLFFGLIFIFADFLSLPFELYKIFGLEEKFGFNKTTPSLFILDKIKGYILTAILGTVLVWPILIFFQKFTNWAWLFCWLTTICLMLTIQYLAPTLILPLFNKFTPIQDEELKEKIFTLAQKCGFNLKGIYIMDGSKRSTKANAFFTGFGKNKRIALFDTLLSNHSHEEILAILAHEIGHFKNKHIHKNLVLFFLQTGLTFLILNLFIRNEQLTQAIGFSQHSTYAAIFSFALIYPPISIILGLLTNCISRTQEFQADDFAAQNTSPKDLIIALKKLSKSNLSNLTPHPLYVFFNYTHPPVLQRIRKLRR